jgi:nucleotide-binding universal stress UspA family protein
VESPYAYSESWYTGVGTDLEALREIWRQAGHRVLERAGTFARQAGVDIETALLEQDGHADLVVVGTHGRHGIEHLLLGSVAEAVARTAPGSVLLVRTH